jgi:multidrug transporter EmrE-like cation transporter
MAYLYLVLAFAANGVANILLKLGASHGLTLSGGLTRIVGNNWQFLLGVFIFAVNVVFYFLALRALPLSVAYPIMIAMSFLIVNGYAFFVLQEPLTALEITGYLFIVAGLTLVVARV